jgi:hypothetical protein
VYRDTRQNLHIRHWTWASCLTRLMASAALLACVAGLAMIPSNGDWTRPPAPPEPPPPPAPPNFWAEVPEPNPANLLRNSSLEYATAPGIPDWWRPGEAWSDFRSANIGVEYALEEEQARFHARSVRLTNSREGNRAALDYPYMTLPSDAQGCVFSVYLKADRKEYPVRLAIYGGFRGDTATEGVEVDHNSAIAVVEVGTEWERFVFASPELRSGSGVRNRVAVIADAVGSLWIDGLQLEMGGEATPYGPRPSDGLPPDGPSGADLATRRALGGITIDGELDEQAWVDAPGVESFVEMELGEPAEALTRAKVLFDEEALYVGFFCQEGLDPTQAASLFTSDHVEVFVSAEDSGWGYRHYAADVSGRIYGSLGRGNRFDTGMVAAAAGAEGGWSAEMRIPFAELGIATPAPEALRMNLARYRAASGEWSCHSRSGETLHRPEVFVELIGLDPRVIANHALPAIRGELVRDGESVFLEGEIDAPERWHDAELRVTVQVLGGDQNPAIASVEGGRFRVAVPEMGSFAPLDLSVAVARADTGETVGLGRLRHLTVPPRAEVFFERSYYTVEDEARLVVRVHDPSIEAVRVATEDGGAGDEHPVSGGLAVIPVPFAKGEDEVEWHRALAGEQELGRAKLVVREPRRNEVKVDYLHRCLVVAGEPFIVMSPGWLVEENLPAVEGGHFNTVMLKRWHEPTGIIYATGQVPEEALAAWRSFLDAAWSRGLRVIFHLPMKLRDNAAALDEEAIDTLVRAFRDHPALLAWHTVDEPGPRATPEKLLSVANLVRELDPYHPVWINEATFWEETLTYAEGAQPACDVYSVDHYPIPDQGTLTIAEWTRRLNRIVGGRKPLFMWIQAFGAIEWWSREPTPAEVREMTYLSFIHGARGVLYFVYRPRSPQLWAECRRLAMEVRQDVAPILGRTIASAPAQGLGAAVHGTVLTTAEGSRYLLALNVSGAEVSFDLGGGVLGTPVAIGEAPVPPAAVTASPGGLARLRLGPSDACLVELTPAG